MAACETVWKKISGQMGGSGRPPSEFYEAKTLHLQVICSALGRTRTCGLLIRSQPPPIAIARHPPSQTAILQGLFIVQLTIDRYTAPWISGWLWYQLWYALWYGSTPSRLFCGVRPEPGEVVGRGEG
jgi:hypothetical protein